MTPTPPIPPELLLPLAAGLPIACALALAAPGWRRMMSCVIPFAALPAAAAAALLPDGSRVAYDGVLLTMQLGMDPTGRLFLLFTSLLWLASGLFGVGYLSADPRRARFFFFFALAMSGNLGLILAQEMVGFYLFFALMSFSAYGLVVHTGTPEALQAGRIYLCLVVVGEISIFAAMALLAAATGDLVLIGSIQGPHGETIRYLFFIGFGIKAGALPLHVWLPPAHSTAPTPASAVLSGAMIKAGLLGWLRFLPIAETPGAFWGEFYIITGLAAAFYAVAVGATQTHPKTILAYSSISQMGLITVGVGIAGFDSAAAAARPAIALYAIHHGFAKGALFLGVAILSATSKGSRAAVIAWSGLLLAALALAGAPLTSGAVAKAGLKASLGLMPAAWQSALALLLPLAAVGTTVLMGRLLWVLRHQSTAGRLPAAIMWGSWLTLTAAVATVLFLLPAAAAARAAALAGAWAALWPVAIGGGVAAGAWMAACKGRFFNLPVVPSGDLVMLYVAGIAWGGGIVERVRAVCTGGRLAAEGIGRLRPPALLRLQKIESLLTGWHLAGLLFLLLIFAIFLKSLWGG